jgi:hypothetical protein
MAENCKELKEKIIKECKAILSKKLELIEVELGHLSKSIAEDTKSSAGDKYETSREMANLEKGKLQSQTQGFNKALATLGALPKKNDEIIKHGCFIKTDRKRILIAVSLGEIKIDQTTVLVISPAAPLAQLFISSKVGDSVSFNKVDYHIESLC